MKLRAIKQRDIRLRTLADLHTLRDALLERARLAAEQAARERATRIAAERTRRLFADAVGRVNPLPPDGTAASSAPRPEPLPRQREADEQAALQEAATTWKLIRAAQPDPRFMAYVAGCQPATVIDYQLSSADAWWRPDLKRLEFIATREGDGTVSWQSGRLPGRAKSADLP